MTAADKVMTGLIKTCYKTFKIETHMFSKQATSPLAVCQQFNSKFWDKTEPQMSMDF